MRAGKDDDNDARKRSLHPSTPSRGSMIAVRAVPKQCQAPPQSPARPPPPPHRAVLPPAADPAVTPWLG